MKRFIITIILATAVVFLLKAFFLTVEGFDYKAFITIAVCSFVLMHKIVQYLAKLKIEENFSRIDIVFIFFIVLFAIIPSYRMDDSETSKRENRMLAQYNDFIHDRAINFNYGKDFEAWFNDRFFGRDLLIAANRRINLKINGKTIDDKGMVGKEGWLYTKQYDAVPMFQNDNLFSDGQLETVKENLEALDSWCKKEGCKFYLFLTPDKESIYPEYYPDNYGKVHDVSRMEQVVDYIKSNTKVKVVYPYKELMDKKKETVVYYKTGTHWNNTGAYVGYKSLFDTIKHDFPALKVMKVSDFNIVEEKHADTDVASVLGLDIDKEYTDKDLVNKMYRLRNINTTQNLIDYKDKEKGVLYTFENKQQKLHAFFYTDSFFLQFNYYAAESFGLMNHVFVGFEKNFDLEMHKDTIKKTKPDIFVIATTERFLHRLLHLSPPYEN